MSTSRAEKRPNSRPNSLDKCTKSNPQPIDEQCPESPGSSVEKILKLSDLEYQYSSSKQEQEEEVVNESPPKNIKNDYLDQKKNLDKNMKEEIVFNSDNLDAKNELESSVGETTDSAADGDGGNENSEEIHRSTGNLEDIEIESTATAESGNLDLLSIGSSNDETPLDSSENSILDSKESWEVIEGTSDSSENLVKEDITLLVGGPSVVLTPVGSGNSTPDSKGVVGSSFFDMKGQENESQPPEVHFLRPRRPLSPLGKDFDSISTASTIRMEPDRLSIASAGSRSASPNRSVISMRDLMNPAGFVKKESPIVSSVLGSLKLSPVKGFGGVCKGDHQLHVEEDSSICTDCPWVKSSYSWRPEGVQYTLLTEGSLELCHLDRRKTILSKVLSSRFLRQWESHHVYLDDAGLVSKTPTGFMESTLKYTAIQNVIFVTRWDDQEKYMLRILIPNGSYIFQSSVRHKRDQWYYSILWKKNIYKFRSVLTGTTRPDILLKEAGEFVEFVTTIPVKGEEVIKKPVEIISNLLSEVKQLWTDRKWTETFISIVAPLLENCAPSVAMCQLYSHHCQTFPKSYIIKEFVSTPVCHILKHNMDFGKYPHMRNLLIDYIRAISCHSNNDQVLYKFVSSVHGDNYECPHRRVLPNLVSVCLSGLFLSFEGVVMKPGANILELDSEKDPFLKYSSFLHILVYISTFEDWVPVLGQLLQTVPVPTAALFCPYFLEHMMVVLDQITAHTNCESHQMVLSARESKISWFDIYSPMSAHCIDRGEFWGIMLERLMGCCCRRKSFIREFTGQRLEGLILLSLHGHEASNDALCLMLEWQLTEEPEDTRLVIATLKATEAGQIIYDDLRRRQKYLEKFQQKGGPERLVMPCRTVDKDFRNLMSTGSFGNLIELSLAFTHVTQDCKDIIIKLPALKILNLWGTKFEDAAISDIAEHLTGLQSLNLCETRVSDAGVLSLAVLSDLDTLNLNSTNTSAAAFNALKCKLPKLVNYDVKYTEAWSGELENN